MLIAGSAKPVSVACVKHSGWHTSQSRNVVKRNKSVSMVQLLQIANGFCACVISSYNTAVFVCMYFWKILMLQLIFLYHTYSWEENPFLFFFGLFFFCSSGSVFFKISNAADVQSLNRWERLGAYIKCSLSHMQFRIWKQMFLTTQIDKGLY